MRSARPRRRGAATRRCHPIGTLPADRHAWRTDTANARLSRARELGTCPADAGDEFRFPTIEQGGRHHASSEVVGIARPAIDDRHQTPSFIVILPFANASPPLAAGSGLPANDRRVHGRRSIDGAADRTDTGAAKPAAALSQMIDRGRRGWKSVDFKRHAPRRLAGSIPNVAAVRHGRQSAPSVYRRPGRARSAARSRRTVPAPRPATKER
jgi:hypothetical protein